MYRLTVVSGPGRGTVFKINEGENTVGRQLGNTVVLPSNQVSKHHCMLIASNGKILIQDQGSANGTYINGSLASNKQLRPGDRIGVGEYVLELSAVKSALPAVQNSKVISLQPHLPSSAPHAASQALEHGQSKDPAILDFAASGAPAFEHSGPPKDLLGRANWAFENYVMPIFYGINLKNEWKIISAVVFGIFLIANLVISVQPLLDANRDVILRESMRRASFMARLIAEKNTAALASGNETKTEIGLPGHSDAKVTTGDGIQLAILTDLDLRILAPAQRINQYLLGGLEVKIAKKISRLFRDGRETGFQTAVGETVVAVEPVKIMRGGRNVTVAMAIVSLDASTAIMGMGEVGLVYSQTLIITALLGALILFILYRLTLKPLLVLGEDMDKALKGEITQVTHEFKFGELNALWDLINSAIQRIPRAASADLSSSEPQEVNPEQFVAPIRAMVEATQAAVAICGADRKVVFMSPAFEKVTGIRAESAIGQDFTNLGTDESVGNMVNELFDQVTAGGDPVTDDKEFGGIQYQLYAAGFGLPTDGAPKAYVLTVIARDG